MTPAHDLAQEVEDERLRQAGKLAADSGPNWADGFRPGTFGCHELLDRADQLEALVEEQLLNHPACVAEAEWYALAERAAAALRELYQRVGERHLAVNEQDQHTTSGSQPTSLPDTKPNQVGGAAVENKDVELVAIWLHGAAREAGQQDLIRGILRRAANEATETYSLSTDHATMEDDETDGFGVRAAIARFIEKWDECERLAREDDDAQS